MIICPNCKSQLNDGLRFCPKCGAQLARASAGAGAANMNQQQYAQQQQYNAQQQYAQNQNNQPPFQQHGGPVAQLKTDRSFIKTVLLSLVTFGIYAIICYGGITDDVNLVCSRYDNRKSMNYYLLFFLVGPITCGIASIVWNHNICDRIGNELKRRQIGYDFGAKDFWLWNVLGAVIIVGPFIFAHKFFTSVNMLNESFNQFG